MNILDQETMLSLFHSYYPFFIGSLLLGTFAVTYFLIPKVIWVSNERGLMAPVNKRSAHLVETPSFGGVAFYVTIILVLCFLQSLRLTYVGNHLIAAITILFMVGLKDDLVVSTAKVKLWGQITAACFLVFSPELQLTTLHGFFGIYEIPHLLGYLINGFIVIALINAYNLIDGIDGLAGMVGIVISSAYAWVFYITGNSFFVLLSISVVGILAAFLRFNFSRRKKIFMGDSGSLVVGLILALLSIKILVMAPVPALIEQGFNPANRLLLLASVLFIPIFDTLRVMLIRILRGDSPFSADRNHAHHVLLNLGFSHFQASACLAAINVLVIFTFVYLSRLLPNVWLALGVVMVYGTLFLFINHLRILGSKEAKRTHAETAHISGVKIKLPKQREVA